MARIATDKKTESAVIAEENAQNNPHFKKIVENLQQGYKPHRMGKANSAIRINNTAMIHNPKPIWGYSNREGDIAPRLLFRAGWYLSIEEDAMVKALLNDPKTKELNEQMWASMEKAGMTVEKTPPSQKDVKVVSGT